MNKIFTILFISFTLLFLTIFTIVMFSILEMIITNQFIISEVIYVMQIM